MKLGLYDVIIEPWITEKVAKATEKHFKYAFRVHPKATKPAIRSAVEKIYNVHVTKVNTANERGKWRRVRYQPGMTADWRKATVTLKPGEKIDLTEQKG